MEGWREIAVTEFGEIITGKTPSKENSEDWGDEVLFITPSDYKNYGKHADSSVRKLSKVGADRQNKRILPPRSILVTCIGSDMGKTVINKYHAVSNQQINSVIVNNKDYCIDYIYYLFKGSEDELKLLGGDGTAVPILNKNDFSKIVYLVPRIAEQQAIAAVLSSLDDKIDLLHRQNKTLENIVQTLFRQWFMEEVDEGKKQNIDVFIEFNPKRELKKGTLAPYIEMSALSATGFSPSSWYMREFASGTKFTNGDTLLARITPCLENGKAAFIQCLQDSETAWGSTEYIVLRPKKFLHPLFAYALVKTADFRDYAESCLAGSSGRQRVELQHLMQYSLNMPPQPKVHQFNDCMVSLSPRLTKNANQIRTLTKLRDTLLPKLMSGEVRVADADTFIDGV